MVYKLNGEQPFQVLSSDFSISPSESGYELYFSADGFNYTSFATVGAGVTRQFVQMNAGNYYKLMGNTGEVSVNWERDCCGGQGGGGTAGVSSLNGQTGALTTKTINGNDILGTGDITIEHSFIYSAESISSGEKTTKTDDIYYGDVGGSTFNDTEIKFEVWCENNPNVEWYYKNGDKGDNYFSIVYEMAFARANFYPDYIVKMMNGDIWIIEAKGGIDEHGDSNNIDSYAKNKFDALKEYAKRHENIKWGFARAVGQFIYFSNTNWDENVYNNAVWKNINDIVK